MTKQRDRPRVASRTPAKRSPRIDILVDSPLWKRQRGFRATLRSAIFAAADLTTTNGEVSVLLADDPAIRALNARWRGIDGPTNVLSFPACCDLPSCASIKPRAGGTLGDIVIAYETTAREALAEGKPFAHHFAHLAVHGFLHLIGYDHAEDAEADAMEALEVAVLDRVGVPNPYLRLERDLA
jgi:probable rRNA maturation factor